MRNRLYLRIVLPFLTLVTFLTAGSIANAFSYSIDSHTAISGDVTNPVNVVWQETVGQDSWITLDVDNVDVLSCTSLGSGAGTFSMSESVTMPLGSHYCLEIRTYDDASCTSMWGQDALDGSFCFDNGQGVQFTVSDAPSGSGGSTPLTEAVSGTYMVTNSMVGGLWAGILGLIPLILGLAALGFVVWGAYKTFLWYRSARAWTVTDRDKKNNLKIIEKAYIEGQKR